MNKDEKNFFIESLKLGDPYFDGEEDDVKVAKLTGRQEGWNDCVDWLHVKGLIRIPEKYK